MSATNSKVPSESILAEYLTRIDWTGRVAPTAAVLRSVTSRHAFSFPFENWDTYHSKIVPSLEIPHLARKFLHQKRGGMCFEQNTLLAASLTEIGFKVTTLAARVRGEFRREIAPRSHSLLLVEVPGEEQTYVADVGFGLPGRLVEAIPLLQDVEHTQFGRRRRLKRELHSWGSLWILQAHGEHGWSDQYVFSLEPYETVDIAAMNWNAATSGPGRDKLYANIDRPEGYIGLAGSSLVEATPEGVWRYQELNAAEAERILTEVIGVEPPSKITWS